MAGNARFHDKLHRKNHHTTPTVGFPDSASDPIASPDQPFQGDFVVNGVLSSSQGISLLSANIDGDIYCDNIHVNDFTYTDYISGNSTEVIISDGSLIGNGNNTLTLDFKKGIYANINNIPAMYINSTGVLINGNLSALGDTTQIDTTIVSTSAMVIDTYGTTDALRITQKGTGNAILVQDEANPDSTPFLINSNGQVVVGSLSSFNDVYAPMDFQVVKSGSTRIGLWSFTTTDSDCGVFSFNKSYSNTVGTSAYNPTFGSNENIGVIDFNSYDAKNKIMRLASIQGELDHYATTVALSGSLPGRITFHTTVSGVSTVSERMRINNEGKVGIGITNLSANPQKLQVSTDALINGITVGNGNFNSNYNTAVGFQALCSTQAINIYNVGIGTYALRTLSGSYNDGDFGLSGRYNTAVGSHALYNSVFGSGNIAIGTSSQRESISGYNNIAIGVNSLYANISGYHNVAVGNNTLRFDQGDSNTAVGHYAMSESLSTYDNVAIGKYALQENLSGCNNVAIGRSALVSAFSSENVAIGYFAGNAIQYGYQNTLLGSRTDTSQFDGVNQIVIGYYAQGIADNTAVLGNDSISATILRGNVGIGTTTPDRGLVIEGDSGAASEVIIRSVENNINTTDGPILIFQNKPLSGYAINGSICGGIGARGFTTVGTDGYYQFAYIGFNSTGNFDALSTMQGCMVFHTASGGSNSEKMRINHDGNVGIGTSYPNKELTVVGDISASDDLYASNQGKIWGVTNTSKSGKVPFIVSDDSGENVAGYTVNPIQIVESSAQLDSLTGGARTYNGSDVFNNWVRYSHSGPTQPARVEELSAWNVDNSNNIIYSTINSASNIGLVSNTVYDSYVHEVRIYSTSTDDDNVGVVIAFYIDPTTKRESTLTLQRSTGTSVTTAASTGPTWTLNYNDGLSDEWNIKDNTSLVPGYKGASGRFYTFKDYGVKIKVVRNKNIIKCSTTDFSTGAVPAYIPAADITIDLESDLRLAKFIEPCPYGYWIWSQQNTYFETLLFVDTSPFYNINSGLKYEYNYATDVWTAQAITETIASDYGVGRIVHDQYTQKSFYIFNPSSIYNIGNPNNIAPTGENNTTVGFKSLIFNLSGNNNTAVGVNALNNITTGDYNVGIGYNVTASVSTVSNEINIYNGSQIARLQGTATSWSFVSDARDKENIQELPIGLEFINQLSPRKFDWNMRHSEVDKGKSAAGFIAQEVEEVVKTNNAQYANLVDTTNPDQYTLAQTGLIPILVKAIQELNDKVDAQAKEILNLKSVK